MREETRTAVTFPVPLPAKVQAAFIGKDQTPPEACADGSIQNPQADPGLVVRLGARHLEPRLHPA